MQINYDYFLRVSRELFSMLACPLNNCQKPNKIINKFKAKSRQTLQISPHPHTTHHSLCHHTRKYLSARPYNVHDESKQKQKQKIVIQNPVNPVNSVIIIIIIRNMRLMNTLPCLVKWNE